MLAQDRREILVGVPLVQEDRLADAGRERELPCEGASLRVARRIVPEVVEAALSDRDDLWRERELRKLRGGIVGELVGMVRVDAGGGEQHAGLRARELHRLRAAWHRGAGHEHLGDARGARARDHGIAIDVEAGMGKVRADVDQLRGGCVIVVHGRSRILTIRPSP